MAQRPPGRRQEPTPDLEEWRAALAETFDVIVAGVGAMGAATCWQLAKRGQKVLGLERFDIPNAMGSSGGDSRMIRLAYFEGSGYVPMVLRARELWKDLGAIAGEQLFFETGTLDMAPQGHGTVENGLAACLEHGLDHQIFSAQEVAARWPQFVLPAGHIALHQPQGGFIASERGIVVQAGLAMDAGADIRAREALVSWEPMGDGVRVVTERGVYEAGSLVLSTGGWLGRHSAQLMPLLRPFRQVFGWFRPKTPALFDMGRMPSFTIVTDQGHYYGFPRWNHPGIKIGGPHHGREACDPETLNRDARLSDVEGLRECLARYIPEGNGQNLATRVCFYTFSPDEHFIIDTLPELPQVVVASPCSGHGYKFATVMGEILADLATGRVPPYDLSQFGLSRFAQT